MVLPRLGTCKAMFEDLCALEYANPTTFGGVHLLTVDAYALQHSSGRSPRSNAFHLMRLCLLLEHGGNPAIGHRPPRVVGKSFEEDYRGFPYLQPPTATGQLTISDVHGAPSPQEHARCVRRYAQSVWNAWAAHHAWAREAAKRS